MCTSTEPRINGRPVLQPTCNRVPTLDRRPMSLNKTPKKSPTAQTEPCNNNNSSTNNKVIKGSKTASPPVSPKLPSPRPPAVKRMKDANESREKALATPPKQTAVAKKSKSSSGGGGGGGGVEAPGSIAAARREQVAIMQVQRKMRTAHYGRTNPSKRDAKVDNSSVVAMIVAEREPKRCSYITPNSDPIYVAYHDEEWGVPVHDDKLLFELLVLTGAQVGSDWTSVLKKREMFREVFSGFDAEEVSKYNEKKITSIASNSGIDLAQVRGAVDNANRILEIHKGFGTLGKYFWGFLNHKPISTQYKLSQRIPVKTSKSESISKDMVRRGFRFVGPTMIHSFMQAAGLTNDHLITCPRHLQCTALASQ